MCERERGISVFKINKADCETIESESESEGGTYEYSTITLAPSHKHTVPLQFTLQTLKYVGIDIIE
jgi:hypothetical protein